jgi:hypothetical protein
LFIVDFVAQIFLEDEVIADLPFQNLDLSPEFDFFDWIDFSSNANFDNSGTDIFEEDYETFLADATSDDFCVSHTNELILKARDDASCKARTNENLSLEDLQFLQDSMKWFNNLLPQDKQSSESSPPPDSFKPAYPGLLTDEEAREKQRTGSMEWDLEAMELEEYAREPAENIEDYYEFLCRAERPIAVVML